MLIPNLEGCCAEHTSTVNRVNIITFHILSVLSDIIIILINGTHTKPLDFCGFSSLR